MIINTTIPADQQTQALQQTFMKMLSGFWISQSIYTAAKLGVADYLQAGPQSISNIAKSLNANEDYLYRLLRALASIGIFQETDDQTFALTPLSTLLCTNAEASMKSVALLLGEENYNVWGYLHQAVKTGGQPFEMAYGAHAYDYFKDHAESAKTFNAAMVALVKNVQAAVAQVYDFSVFKTIVDVGGGYGALLGIILRKFPDLQAILFDLPQVIDEVQPFLVKEGIESRCKLAAGNFFEAITASGDAYILSHVLHGFSDELSLKILTNIYQASPAHAKILLVEDILQTENTPETAATKFMDLNMLVMTPGGRDRTRQEFDELLGKAGFFITAVIPTQTGSYVIEGQKN
jgi:hypothetical protein